MERASDDNGEREFEKLAKQQSTNHFPKMLSPEFHLPLMLNRKHLPATDW
ncbi:MAG: hypothetical protein R3E74_11085 [Pseudomonadales bacterium]